MRPSEIEQARNETMTDLMWARLKVREQTRDEPVPPSTQWQMAMDLVG